ncbi:MAG: T9SS type A sorting domain-containing protein [Bacteroidales bacterium]
MNQYLQDDAMKVIKKLFVILVMILFIVDGAQGQGSPGNFPYSAVITDSLFAPVRMAIDHLDNIFVTDAYQKKIKKYNAAGIYLGSITTIGSPISIAINETNTLFIGDGETGKIFRLNANGTTSELYAGTVFPSSMVFCSDGLLYVSDTKLQRVIVLDMAGHVIRTIGAGTLICPTGITFDKRNNRILVAEHGGVGNGFNPVVNVKIYGLTGNLITTFGSNGNGDGKFYRIQGLAVGRCGEIYVPEPYQGNVSVFNENTTFAARFGNYGDSLSQLRVPLDIAINSEDRIFITAENNGTIEIFNIDYVLPTSDISCGNKTICAGTSTDIPVHFTGTAPWTFTYTINGSNPATITATHDNPYNLTVSAAGNYEITALSDSSRAGTCFSGHAIITVNNIVPTSTIAVSNSTLCPDQSVDIPVVLTGMAPWQFTYTQNGINPQSVSNITATPYYLNLSAPGTYEITTLTGAGCVGSEISGSAIVTSKPAPSAMISNPASSMCAGDTTFLEINFTGTAPWGFTYTVNDQNPVEQHDITENPFRLPVTASGIYKIIQVMDGFCFTSTPSGTAEVTVKARPTSTILSGNSAFCPGDSASIVIGFTGTSPWNFTCTVEGSNPAIKHGVTVNPYSFNVADTGTYRVTYLSDAGCEGSSFTGSASITENKPPVVSLGPPVSLCEGDSLIIGMDSSYVFYIWSDSTTAPTMTAYTAGIYSVTVTDYKGCRSSGSKMVTSLPVPTSHFEETAASICSGETTDLTVTLAGTPPWSLSYSINDDTPQTINNITVSPYQLNVYKPGVYRITETADALCRSNNSSSSTIVTVNPLPLYNISSGNGSICSGQSVNMIIDFTGTPPWNFTYTINGQNPVTINGVAATPFILPVFHGGTYEIIELSDAFCRGPAHNGTATITEFQLPAFDLGSDAGIVPGEMLTLDAGPLFAGYLWNDGSNGQSLQVNSAGSYTVTVTDYNGCSTSDMIQVYETTVPVNRDLQQINISGTQCFGATQTITVAGGGTTFMVHTGGEVTLIAGLNILYLPGTTVDSGGYMLGYITPDNIFCGGMPPAIVSASKETEALQTETTGIPAENGVRLYPNPSTGLITLEVTNPLMLKSNIEISDMAGRHLYSKELSGIRIVEKVDLAYLPGGFYMVRVSSGNYAKVIKLILID